MSLIHRVGAMILMLGLAGGPLAAAPPVGKTFDSNGVKIHYIDTGKGEPVVLIHGLNSSALINWQLPGVVPMLAGDYRVIALDLRGHGGSDKPEGEAAYGVELAEDVTRLLDHLGIKQAHVVGYSLGGMVAVKFVARHPERVKSAVVGGMGWLRQGSPLQEFWGRIRSKEGGRTPPVGCIRSIGALAVTEADVRAIRTPVTILVGDRDPVRALYVEPLKRVRPDWPVVTIDDAGHFDCILKEQFRDEIHRALDRRAGK
jgi:pimeloyl-ACP methyl ester carboxylesterase